MIECGESETHWKGEEKMENISQKNEINEMWEELFFQSMN